MGFSRQEYWSGLPFPSPGEESSALLGAADRSPGTFQVALVVKNPPGNAGDLRDTGSIPGSGRSPGEENGYPFQYSCLENPMDRGAS